MRIQNKFTQNNSLVFYPWARQFMPGEPRHRDMAEFNKLLLEADKDGDLFAAISPATGSGLTSIGYRDNSEYLVIFRRGVIDGTAVFEKCVSDKNNYKRPVTDDHGKLFIPLDDFMDLVSRDKANGMSETEFKAFSERMTAKWKAISGKVNDAEMAEKREEFAEAVEDHVKGRVSETVIDKPRRGRQAHTADPVE